jgi:hypothetical protein
LRAKRAYLAGFGTTGSLLVLAAAIFVLASAFVAFRGWPQVGDQSGPGAVVISPQHPGPPSVSPSGLRLAALVTPGGRATAAGGAVLRRTRGAVTRPGSGAATENVTGGRSVPSSSGHPQTPGSAPAGSPPSPHSCASCGGSPSPGGGGGGLGSTVQQTTGSVSTAVSSTGNGAGSVVTGVAGAVANTVSGVSPPLAGVVNNVGSAAGNVVNGVTSTAANAVGGAGSTVGNALNGATSTVSGAVGGVTNAVGGVLGGR